jgi:hypothetical protein
MIFIAFRKRDLLWPGGLLLFTFAAVAWKQYVGQHYNPLAFPAVLIAIANFLMNGYYSGLTHLREVEWRASLEAQPLVDLKAELVRELRAGRTKVDALKAEVQNLQEQHVTAEQLASLDKAAVLSLLEAISLPDRRSTWIERLFGFLSGIIASLVASVLYDLTKH